MGIERDTRDKIQRAGSKGAGLPIPMQRLIQSHKLNRNLSGYVGESFQVLDPLVDQVWAEGRNDSLAPHNYFDYYFTGQDIKVFIDGATENGELHIMQFAYNVQQQKQPLYGFASYTYDAMMRGTRIVNGVMRIATTNIHHMTNLLQQAAESRANQMNGLTQIRGLTEDEELIERYWTKNIDPEVSYKGNKHIWSSHPPFNFIIAYGLQATSIGSGSDRVAEIQREFGKNGPDNAFFSDINERLVESDPINYSQRRVIENVELTGLQVEYDPEGRVCSEVYSFLARDIKLMKL